MDNELISKSKRCRFNLVVVCIGILMLMFFVYLFDLNFQPKNIYQEDLKALGFILLTILTIYCVYYLLNQKRFYIYKKHFEKAPGPDFLLPHGLLLFALKHPVCCIRTYIISSFI